MNLYIVRHAWAEQRGDPRWPDDRKRPLTEDGQERFARVVEVLAERGVAPAVIATSPLKRCRQTADILARHLPESPKVVPLDVLAPGSDLRDLAAWTNDQEGDVAWVGHAPDVGLLAAALIGKGGQGIRFAKGASAAIRFDEPVEPAAGELYWLVTAKMLGC